MRRIRRLPGSGTSNRTQRAHRRAIAVAGLAMAVVLMAALAPAASADPAQWKWRDDNRDGICPWKWSALNWLNGGDMAYDKNGDEIVCLWVG